MKLLLIEDDEAIIAALSHSLRIHHSIVDAVTDAEAGWTYATTYDYDLIVLDIILPQMDGIHFCQKFREEGYTTPILLLTAQDSPFDKVRGLDAGADDYVVKPFDIDELSARIRALLRRGKASPFPLLMWEDLALNPSTFEVTYQGKSLVLTIKEYELLELFLRDCRHVFSSDEILDKLWSSEEFPVESTVRSHVRRLRNKLVAAGAPHDFISTIYGRGYYLKPSPSDPLAENEVITAVDEHPSQLQQTFTEFLGETWLITKPKCLAQLSEFNGLIQRWETGNIKPQQQEQAKQIAHKLVGTLGIFDLTEMVDLARDLEVLLKQPLQHPSIAPLKDISFALTKRIEKTDVLPGEVTSARPSPLLWLIASETPSTQALQAAVKQAGLRTATASSLPAARSQLLSQSTLDKTKQPELIVIQLPPQSAAEVSLAPYWEFLQELTQPYPDSPILLVGRQLKLEERLELNRLDGKILLESSGNAESILKAVTQLLGWQQRDIKVMAVDDDFTWLQALPSLLTPWGFNVSTLAEPKQFWSVLEAVNPDALILDVNMPDISGLELCQLLRSDLRWRQLPILFLSALNDLNTQQKAFTVGADDYLLKPVFGKDLAHRIRNRLYRA